MRVLADTSAFLAVVLDEPERPWLLKVTEGIELVAPAVLPYEVGNALSALVKRGRLDRREAVEAWQAMQSIAVGLAEIDIAASLRLATEYGIYAYDAYFMQCAIQQGYPLLTLDRAMRRVARVLKIKLVEEP